MDHLRLLTRDRDGDPDAPPAEIGPRLDLIIEGDPGAFFWLLSAAGNARDGLRENWAESTDGHGNRLVLEPARPEAQQIPRSPTGHLRRPHQPTAAAAAAGADPLAGVPHREIPIDSLELDQARERLRHVEGRIGLGYITPAQIGSPIAGAPLFELADVEAALERAGLDGTVGADVVAELQAAADETAPPPAPPEATTSGVDSAPAAAGDPPTPATSPELDAGAPAAAAADSEAS